MAAMDVQGDSVSRVRRPPAPSRWRPGRKALVAVAIADGLRLLGAIPLGLGDAEALYAGYADHPQGGYLDHPPLIGWASRLALSVHRSAYAMHVLAVALFTLSAWLLFRFTRDLFGGEAAWWATAALCVLPVFHLGGLAAAPDAVLAPLWIATLWGAWSVWRRAGGAVRPPAAALLGRGALLGVLLGAAFLGKYSAVALVPLLAMTAFRAGGGIGAAAAALGAVAATAVASPVIAWNVEHDWISLAHRFVWSQAGGAGLSLRNVGALVGGQLLYLSPVAAAGLAGVLAWGWRRRGDPAVRFCLWAVLPALGILSLVCVWSRVAEPHWPAAAWLGALPLAGRWIAEAGARARRWVRTAGWTAAGMNGLVYLTVLTPVLPALVPRPPYDPRWDLGNELYGWEEAAAAVRSRVPSGGVVSAGHYTMCAQLAFHLHGSGLRVRCRTAEPSDFDLWVPRGEDPWSGEVWFVTDDRYPRRPVRCGSGGAPMPEGWVRVRRGGEVVRRFGLTRYGSGEFPPPGVEAGACPAAGSGPD
jgi:4-amino-4-deoxy-L-arabinose transferase-like glycosyltransferase